MCRSMSDLWFYLMTSMVPDKWEVLNQYLRNVGHKCKMVGKPELWRRWAATTTIMSLYGDKEHSWQRKSVQHSVTSTMSTIHMTPLKLDDIQRKEKRNMAFYLLPCLGMWKFINLHCVLPMSLKATITSISVARIFCYHIDNDHRILR